MNKNSYIDLAKKAADLQIKELKKIKKVFNKIPNVLYCPHHLSHLYTSEYLLQNKDPNTLNIILDAYGEGLSGAIYSGQGKNIKLIKEYKTSSSIGILIQFTSLKDSL